jgi:hypothetical protein
VTLGVSWIAVKAAVAIAILSALLAPFFNTIGVLGAVVIVGFAVALSRSS